MKRTPHLTLSNAAIGRVYELLGHCAAANAVPLADTILTFEKLIDLLRALRRRLPNGDALIVLARGIRREFVRGERAAVAYDLEHRILPPLLADRPKVVAPLPTRVSPEAVAKPTDNCSITKPS